MAIRKLTYALAAAGMIAGTTAQATAPLDASVRSGASMGEAEQLGWNHEWIPVIVAMLAILSIIVFADDDDPVSP
jgi:hypothetical protein